MKYRADGTARCQDCAEDPVAGRVRCADCAARHLRYSARRRKELKAAGRCVVCGGRAKKGRTVCARHMAYYVQRVDARRRARASRRSTADLAREVGRSRERIRQLRARGLSDDEIRAHAERVGDVAVRTRARRLAHNGQTQTVAAWARATGINEFTIRHRIRALGWTVERALTTPTRRRGTP